MHKLTRSDLLSLEEYSNQRKDFRARAMAHRKNRRVALGDHVTLLFEDRLTIQYQVQEMLRAERIFEAAGIEEELVAYNPLIPDGSNLKATLLIEYTDVAERKQALARLIGLEDKVWIRVSGFEPVYPIADEDLERDDESKTSSVHFLRFEFTPEMIAAAKAGEHLEMGVDHPEYQVAPISLTGEVRQSLVADFD